jgi:hypothetical protein
MTEKISDVSATIPNLPVFPRQTKTCATTFVLISWKKKRIREVS